MAHMGGSGRYEGGPTRPLQVLEWLSANDCEAIGDRRVENPPRRDSHPGVLSPESCLDPMSFFAEVAQYATVKPTGGKLLEESFEVLE